MNNIIDSFTGKYFFLSNFYEIPVQYSGYTFQNNEAAFQAMKCPTRMEDFIDLPPNKAKALGRKVKLRHDWEDIKENVMFEIVFNKFSQNLNLKQCLKDTGDAILIEGNTWGDRYWGQVSGEGENKLGQILMKVRDLL